MRILIFTDWFYPACKAGGPVQSVVNMVNLIKHDHDIFIYTKDRDLNDKEPFAGIPADQWIHQQGYTIQYYTPGSMTLKKARDLIKEINPDRIYLNSMFSNMIYPMLAAYTSGKIIQAARGMLRPSALQVKPLRKYLYLSFIKMLGMERQICFHATSEEEKKDIHRIFPAAKDIRIASNLPVKVQDQLMPMTKSPGELKMIFVGRIHPIKNLLFLLGLIEKVTPKGLRLIIVGSIEDKNYWEKCLRKIEQLKVEVEIDLYLDCPHEKVKDLLAQSHLFVLPTEGENFGHAIFEALAVGCPVLISDQTPWRNLAPAKAGADLPLEQSQFTERLQAFIGMDATEWEKFRIGAHELARDYEKKQDVHEQYTQLLEMH